MNVDSMIKASRALLKLANTIFMRISNPFSRSARFIRCLTAIASLAMTVTLISRKAGTLMSPLLLEAWQNWSNFVLTPKGLSIICLLISVSCSVIILSSLLRILAVLRVSLTRFLTLLKQILSKLERAWAAKLPSEQQAKAYSDIEKAEKKIEKYLEVVKNAECRLFALRNESNGCQDSEK